MHEYLCKDTITGEVFGCEAESSAAARQLLVEQYDGDATKVQLIVVPDGMLERLGVDVY